MKRRLVLVIDKAEGRLFESSVRQPPELSLVMDFTHEEGRQKEGDFFADDRGRMYDGGAPNKSGFEPEVSPTETSLKRFIKKVAGLITQLSHPQPVELVVMAGPHVLGLVRQEFEKVSTVSVIAEVRKDLSERSAHEIARYLDEAEEGLPNG